MIDRPSHSKPPTGLARWTWAVFLIGLIGLGAGQCALGAAATGSDEPPKEALPPADDSERLGLAYGLTPIDLAGIADTLADREGAFVAAGYPGKSAPLGTVLTRSPHAGRILSKHGNGGSRTALQPVSGPWRRLTRSGPTSYDGSLDLARARVWTRRDGEKRPCPRTGLERFRCDNPNWSRVEWRDIKIGGSKKRCIWSHPIRGRHIVIDFGTVAPVEAGYRIETAIADHVANKPAPVTVTLERNGREKTISHGKGKGWQRADVPEPTRPGRLTVDVYAEKVGQRHFCFRVRQK